jgi:hypothetical protein
MSHLSAADDESDVLGSVSANEILVVLFLKLGNLAGVQQDLVKVKSF